MKTRNKFCALAAAVSLLAGMLPMGAAASGGASMSIDTDTVIKNQSAQMYGISTDYAVNLPYLSYNEETDKIEQSIQFKTAMNEYGFPLVRIGEGASDTFKWKQAIGPWADRTEQTLWNTTGKVAGGTAEYAELFSTIDAGAQFTVTLNMDTDTAQDAADLAQFLTGGADTEWGKKRIDYGFEKPFNVKAYELGNELDWSGVGGSEYTVAQYIADCKTYIAAVRAVSPDAKFIAFADTANYNKQKSGEDWRAWHKAILADAELAGEIDYIALHTYFDLVNNGLMDTIISAIEEDIAASAGKDRIKVYLSEYAVSNFTTPHSMDSILETANILSRTMWHDGIEMATYHGISSAAWQNIIYNSSTGEMRLNGIGNMLKMFKNYGVGDVLSTNFTGFVKNTNSTASGVAARAADGKIKVIMTNDSASELPVKLNFSDSAEYQLNDEMIITASEPEKSGKDVKTQKYTYASPSVVTQYTMPKYSVCAITLEKRKNVTKTTLYSNDFSNDETYTVYGSDSAQVADGKLSFTGSALGANYVYLPYKNENASFRFEADITVDEILDEENENGILINSSKNDGEFNDGNLIKIKGGTVTEVTYENGNQGETLGEGTTDPLESEKTIHIVYDKTAEGSVSFSINGAEVYSRSGGVKNSAGYIGFLFADSYSVDNAEISNYSAEEIEKTEIKKTFTYEENFDELADGTMPEGWEVMSSELTAGVQDGAFVVDAINSEWDKTYDVIQFTNLGNVQRDGLVMEADFTMLSYNTSAKGYGQRPFAGFAHTVDGEKMGSIGHLSFYPQSEAREYGSSSTPTGSTVDLGGEAYAAGTKTLHLKAVYGAKGSPDLYIDGTKVSYYNISDTSVNMGKIGLAGYLTKFKIDNLKITGIKSEVYSASDVTEITVPFDYEENFDNIAEGSLPAGWYVGDINGDTPTISASVNGGKLVMKNNEWWHGDYMVFGNLGEVYNNGVTVEFDVTATTKTVSSSTQNVTNNAGVGPAYAIGETDGKAEGYSVKFFTAVNPTTHKIVAQKQESSVTDYNIALAEGETNVMSGATKRVKIVMVNNTQTPDIYIDGVKVNAGRYGWRGDTVYTSETGKVGIFLRAAGVEIDNVHVSGKRKIKVSGTSTIDAAFKSAGGVYDTEEDAIADVRVMQKFTSGDELDVTSMANITSSVSGFDGVITVTYDGKEIKKLPYKLNVKEESFVYEENFDNIADGSLPAGWYVGDINGDTPTISASVNGGKLVMKNNEWWHGDYMVFGNLGEVYNNGVTVEFDVTATTKTVSSSTQNVTNNAGVGPAYAIGETDGKAEGYSVKFFTAVNPTTHKIVAQKQESSVTDYNIALAEGETNVMSGATKRVKIVMVNNTQTPDIYIDGVKVNAGKYGWRGDTAYTSETGKVGIFLRSAGVEIDNVRVSGKRLVPVSQTGENKIAVTSAALSGDKLNITVNAQNYGADTSAKLFAAVYGADGKLIGVSGLKDWNSAIYDTTLTVDGMSGYTPETHTIKVMAWDFGTLKPISGSAVK